MTGNQIAALVFGIIGIILILIGIAFKIRYRSLQDAESDEYRKLLDQTPQLKFIPSNSVYDIVQRSLNSVVYGLLFLGIILIGVGLWIIYA